MGRGIYREEGKEVRAAKDSNGSLITLKSVLPLSAKVAYPLDGSRTSHLGQTQC